MIFFLIIVILIKIFWSKVKIVFVSFFYFDNFNLYIFVYEGDYLSICNVDECICM